MIFKLAFDSIYWGLCEAKLFQKSVHGLSLSQTDSVNSSMQRHCSFPVPFDEDDRDDSVWFLDHDYLENMYGMFKKVNGKAQICVIQLGFTLNVFL